MVVPGAPSTPTELRGVPGGLDVSRGGTRAPLIHQSSTSVSTQIRLGDGASSEKTESGIQSSTPIAGPWASPSELVQSNAAEVRMRKIELLTTQSLRSGTSGRYPTHRRRRASFWTGSRGNVVMHG